MIQSCMPRKKVGWESLVETIWNFSDDICMKLDVDKSPTYVPKRGKNTDSERIRGKL